ncbi:PPOX class F420-dependent oxidoreductase [Streptomyces sp. 4503]|uniref:PPOX class F420-dependent oxidoreductase n=1 Tax=Streptomyces niphimycinicus TaxID=2842201 RepID=A0ABS6CP25_9ACTN|nr:PPOX class F420-dependent oxidoreductase [Streptomyces niphimycinicus]MBU3868677.1 PPOX class F420-dependent oxidoreductase [Streptomyces niphimycinicus]
MDEIRRSKYISLTTYRKDGSPVPTPVWHVAGPQGEILVVTPAGSWKVKRIRNNSAVTVTVCDLRGRTSTGAASLPGTARLLDQDSTMAAQDLLGKRYITSRIGNWFVKVLHLPKKPNIAIAITL